MLIGLFLVFLKCLLVLFVVLQVYFPFQEYSFLAHGSLWFRPTNSWCFYSCFVVRFFSLFFSFLFFRLREIILLSRTAKRHFRRLARLAEGRLIVTGHIIIIVYTWASLSFHTNLMWSCVLTPHLPTHNDDCTFLTMSVNSQLCILLCLNYALSVWGKKRKVGEDVKETGGGAVCWRGGKKTVMEISRGEQSDQLTAWRPDVQNDGEEEKNFTSVWREVVTLN